MRICSCRNFCCGNATCRKPICCYRCICPPCPPIPQTYTIIYNPNGGFCGTADFDLLAGSSYTIKSALETGVSRPGYTFLGWNTEPDGSGTVYVMGDVITVAQNLILYAQWEIEAPNTVTVIYDPNGGTGGTIDANIPIGSNYTIKTQVQAGVSRTDYIFVDWNTESDGSGITYAPSSVIALSDDLTLYAQWMIQQVVITYHPDFANGTPASEFVDINTSYTLRAIPNSALLWPGIHLLVGIPIFLAQEMDMRREMLSLLRKISCYMPNGD